MAVPKQKKSKAKVRSRRANHDKITLPNVSICSNCGADVLSHRACPECGYYKGRQAVSMKIATVEDVDEVAEA
jgi:large subunit ribosomal protein L32